MMGETSRTKEKASIEKPKGNVLSAISKALMVGLVLLFMVLVIHHPLLKDLKKSRLPFASEPDTYYIISVIQWNMYAMSHELPALYHLNYFYPHAYVTFYGHPVYGESLVFLGFNKLLGLDFTRSYDLYLLMAFWIGALGTFLLTRELTQHPRVPYFAAFLFIIYPYIRQLYVHLNVFSFFWVGFVFYFLIRFQRNGQWKDAFYAGFFTFLQGIFSVYHGFFLIGILWPVFVLLSLFTGGIRLKNLLKLSLALFIFVILLAVLFHPFLSAIKHSELQREFDYPSLIDADMLFSSGSWFYERIKAFGITAMFPGFSVLFLFSAALIGLNKKKSILIFLLLLSLVGVLVLNLEGFSLAANWAFFAILFIYIVIFIYRFKEIAPGIRILFACLFLFLLLFYKYSSLVPGTGFSLYGLIVGLIPSISDFRFLYRAIIIFIPVLFALAAYGLLNVLKLTGRKKILVLGSLVLLVLLENGYLKTTSSTIQFHPYKYEGIEKEGDRVILELPIYTDAEVLNNLYTINTLFHHNYYINGRVAFRPFEDNYLVREKVTNPEFPDPDTLRWLLEKYAVNYIIFNWKEETPAEKQRKITKIRELEKYCLTVDKGDTFLVVRLMENFPVQKIKRRYSLFHLRHRELLLVFKAPYTGKISLVVPGKEAKTGITVTGADRVTIPFPPVEPALEGTEIEVIFEYPVELQDIKLVPAEPR